MTVDEAMKLLEQAGFTVAYQGDHAGHDGHIAVSGEAAKALGVDSEWFWLYEETEHGETHLSGCNMEEPYIGVLDLLSEADPYYGGGVGGWWDAESPIAKFREIKERFKPITVKELWELPVTEPENAQIDIYRQRRRPKRQGIGGRYYQDPDDLILELSYE
jgi:hypothetical protein